MLVRDELPVPATPVIVVTTRVWSTTVIRASVIRIRLGVVIPVVAVAIRGAADAELDVVVGGLGLGYTAQTALDDPRVHCLVVVEALEEVIGWHQRALLPDTAELASDPRVRLQRGDFFAMADSNVGFDPEEPGRRFHAILLDVNHTPRHVLHPSHRAFYTPAGLRKLVGHLLPGGVFALWSDDPPDPDFEAILAEVFDRSEASVVRFPNPLTGGYSTNTVYVAS